MLAALATAHAMAAPGSAGCAAALAELEAREQAVLALPNEARPAQRQRLIEQRRRAATACLDGPPDAPPRVAIAAPAAPAAPVRSGSIDIPPLPSALPAPRTAETPAAVRPPVTVTTCDALGCWASDGTRLQKSGPSLLGPGGFCSSTGGFLHCP